MPDNAKEIADLQAKLDALRASHVTSVVQPPKFQLDLGCGKKKQEGWTGVDIFPFPGVDVVHDLARHRWPWEDSVVDEVRCHHTIEHFTWEQRVFFFNELWRVMKPGAKAEIVVPHWCSNRYYGDPTHLSPISEMAFAYLDKEWRKKDAPHVDSEECPGPMAYSCDFTNVIGYSVAPWLAGRNPEYVQHALTSFKEAAQDMSALLTARKT